MNTSSFRDFNLSEALLNSIEKLEYKSPTEIQEKVIPLVLQGRDLIGKSQTGSGKTAAFGIPICENLNIEEKNPQALILTPTRELCVQIKEDINNLGRYKRVRCAAVFGKQPIVLQAKELKQRVHVVVGTPGRTMDHIERGNLNLQSIKYLIIDEADKMLNMGFIEQVEAIVKSIPKDRVTLLFSATIPEKIQSLCYNYMKDPIQLEIQTDKNIPDTIVQSCYMVSEVEKADLLREIIYIENPKSSIIFCDTKDKVDYVYKQLRNWNFSCNKIHGGMLQDERLNVMKSFKNYEFTFLVATDVAGRGIDIDSLDLIINYDVPFEKESYLHRIGRTGRAGNNGTAITFVSPYENRYFDEIQNYIEYSIPIKERISSEQILKFKESYIKESMSKPIPKAPKGSSIGKDITKLYIKAGKKKKIRPVDIVGTITSIEGITPEDIGIIDISDNFTYVDILNNKGNLVLNALKNMTIKGKEIKVEKAKD